MERGEELILLREAFPQLSAKVIAAAYEESDFDVMVSADLLEKQVEGLAKKEEARTTTLSKKSKHLTKASTGSISGARRCQSRVTTHNNKKNKEKNNRWPEQEAESQKSKNKEKNNRGQEQESQKSLEEFLFSMLGDEIDLGMDTVRDVIYECGGDSQKSLDSLLEIISNSDSSNYAPGLAALLEAFPERNRTEVVKFYKESNDDLEAVTNKLLGLGEENHKTKGKESTYQVLFNELVNMDYASTQQVMGTLSSCFPDVDKSTLLEILKANNYDYRATTDCLTQAGIVSKKPADANMADGLLQQLFKPHQRAEDTEELETDDLSEWKVVSFKQKIKEKPPPEELSKTKSEWEKYRDQSESAATNWASMKACFHEAAVAYQNGERGRATLLSKKGQQFKERSQVARARASNRIFNIKNRSFQNNITIDLHDQHADEAIKLLELHLKALRLITSVHTLTVITGRGVHAENRKPKLKPAILAYLDRKGIAWVEVNPGCLKVNVHSVELEATEK